MIDPLNKDEISALIDHSGDVSVSIFMPTQKVGREVQQNDIRLRNLLKMAEDKLIERGMRGTDARRLLKPAMDLLENSPFWQHQSEGLAVFVSASFFRSYRVPLALDEEVAVNSAFHIKPILPVLQGEGHYYVLAISQNELRLFRGSRDVLEEIDLGKTPRSLAEALKYDDPERQLQFHTQTQPRPGGAERAAMFHGTSGIEDNVKTDILRYFQIVDKGIRELLVNEPAPLVLAGVDFLHPIYREASDYPMILQEGIEGSPEEWGPRELHELAWPLVQPHFLNERNEAADRYKQLAGGGLASGDLAEVVAAAYYGRISYLFVAVDFHRWGQFDPASGTIEEHEEPGPDDVDLVDLAAAHTYLNGGTVYALPPAEMPDAGAVAAIFRYALQPEEDVAERTNI